MSKQIKSMKKIQTIKKSKSDIAKKYIFMLIACCSYGLSILFTKPNQIIGGGISGASVLISLLTESDIAGILSIAMNIPIAILAWKMTGTKFILNCLLTFITLGLVIGIFENVFHLKDLVHANIDPSITFITRDKILAALYAGILQGIGIGLFIRYEMSSAGTELLGRITYRVIPIGSIAIHAAIFDAIVVGFGALAYGIQNILYALILVFSNAIVSDLIVLGIDKAKLCYIISDKAEEISEYLISTSPRGVTLIQGEGMYSKQPHGIILTCVKKSQVVSLKASIKHLDENAFIIVTEANEVYGKGFKHI